MQWAIVHLREPKSTVSNWPLSRKNSARALAVCAGAFLLPALCTFGGPSLQPLAPPAETRPAAFPAELSAPIDVSEDGELLLLFRRGGRGFELFNTRTARRDIVSATRNTGYYATISPDKKYVCFKDFQVVGRARLQVPALYDIAGRKTVFLDKPAPTVGNPVASARGQIAYTVGKRLVVLNPDVSRFLEVDLGVVANVLAFSPDGGRLAFGDPSETISCFDLATRTRRALPAAGVRGYQPRFSPDGQTLLARSSNGEVTAAHLSTGAARSFGRARAAGWADEETVALVGKAVANYTVTNTYVVKCKLSDGSTKCLLSKPSNAEVAIHGSVIALVTPDGITLADVRTGRTRKPTLPPPPVPGAPEDAGTDAPGPITPFDVVTNSTTVQLLGVPYINQVYDTQDSFTAYSDCCNVTAGLMAIQYYNRLPAHPITCTARSTSHTSNYGYYISGIYSYNGIVFDIPSSSVWGASKAGWYGGFGYYLQDITDDSRLQSTRLSQWIAYHDLTSGTDDNTSYAKAQGEIDANCPLVVMTSLTGTEHHVTCIGYLQNQYTLICNDPFGNKNISYPGAQGAGACYDWPGHNNGYQNLNDVWRYVYARGSAVLTGTPGTYWDLNGTNAGSGPAPSGTWDGSSANWSADPAGAVAPGTWAGGAAIFSAGSDAIGSYTITVLGVQTVSNLFVEEGTVTFIGGELYFTGTGAYLTNYVAAGATAIFNTPFGGAGSPDKWGPGTAVYNGASISGSYFSVNEGTLAFGNDAALGTSRLVVGDPDGINVVTLESADATAHTLPNPLTLSAISFNIGPAGNLTFTGPVDTGPGSSIIAVSNSLTTLSGVITNAGGLTKTGPGTLVLGGTSANSYGSTSAYGNTTVNAGTLQLSKTTGVAAVPNGSLILNGGGTLLLGAANQIGDAVPMTLGGGVFQTAGFSEQVSTLKLTADSVIDLGAGASALKFAASSGEAWTEATTLTITNWNGSIAGGGAAQVVFGSNSSGLSAGQVSQIRFANQPGFPSAAARILSTGEVVPLAAAPSITLQPQSQVALAGDSVAFTSAASGTPAPAYQWRFNGMSLSGATAATLLLPSVTLSQAGSYSVVITNVAGSTTSASAMLAVYASAAPTLCAVGCSSNGQFHLDLAGVPGYRYAILVSTNLSDWAVLQANYSPCTITDTSASLLRCRFYRAQYWP